MISYITMLRGINVSGQKKIKMDELKKLYESLGFSNVKTYIQSGNVVFESTDSNTSELTTKISGKINEIFGFEVPVIIRIKEEIKGVIDNTPYGNKDINKLAVIFLSGVPTQPPIEEINKVKDDSEEYFISGKEVYLYIPNGAARTKLSNNFFERKLKLSATSRNWKTVNKLMEIADG